MRQRFFRQRSLFKSKTIYDNQFSINHLTHFSCMQHRYNRMEIKNTIFVCSLLDATNSPGIPGLTFDKSVFNIANNTYYWQVFWAKKSITKKQNLWQTQHGNRTQNMEI